MTGKPFCMASFDGHTFMKSHYDWFPMRVRTVLQASPFNLCIWRVYYAARDMAARKRRPRNWRQKTLDEIAEAHNATAPSVADCLAVIEAFKEQIRAADEREVQEWLQAMREAAD